MKEIDKNDLIKDPDIGERNAVPEDFIGKTITGFDSSACNVWRFMFSDGTSLAIEAEVMSMGNYGSGIPIMQICVPCGAVPPEDEHAT